MKIVLEMGPLSFVDKSMLICLLRICKKNQGATCYELLNERTYSCEFIDATIEICRILKRNGYNDPRWWLMRLFWRNDIGSCRTGYFTDQTISYLYNNFVRLKLR